MSSGENVAASQLILTSEVSWFTESIKYSGIKRKLKGLVKLIRYFDHALKHTLIFQIHMFESKL